MRAASGPPSASRDRRGRTVVTVVAQALEATDLCPSCWLRVPSRSADAVRVQCGHCMTIVFETGDARRKRERREASGAFCEAPGCTSRSRVVDGRCRSHRAV